MRLYKLLLPCPIVNSFLLPGESFSLNSITFQDIHLCQDALLFRPVGTNQLAVVEYPEIPLNIHGNSVIVGLERVNNLFRDLTAH